MSVSDCFSFLTLHANWLLQLSFLIFGLLWHRNGCSISIRPFSPSPSAFATAIARTAACSLETATAAVEEHRG